MAAIFVIIPAYNEAGALPATIVPLIEAGYTVVVVDDGQGLVTVIAIEHRSDIYRPRQL